MPFQFCSPAVPLPCRSTKALDCLFSILFTQCGHAWFTHAMPFPCRSPAVPLPCHEYAFLKATSVIRSIPISDAVAGVKQSTLGEWQDSGRSWQGRGRRTAGERHGMCESVFKTAGEQQGNGMGTAWERHGMCESAFSVSSQNIQFYLPANLMQTVQIR
jgi:hypothetical protein